MTTGILLAAGKSDRFGSPKLLLDVQGEPLIVRMATTALTSNLDRLIVVVGAFRDKIKDLLKKYPVTVCENKEWESGLGSSIKSGIGCLQKIQDVESTGALIMVADQPLLSSSYLNQLIEEAQKNPDKVIASAYSDTYGVPVVYPSKYFNEIHQVSDEQGAKQIIYKHQDELISLPFPAGKYDLDTQEDYDQIIEML